MECKQCRPWSDCSFRSSLIWVCTVCICHFVRHFGVQNFKTFTVVIWSLITLTPLKRTFFSLDLVCSNRMTKQDRLTYIMQKGTLIQNANRKVPDQLVQLQNPLSRPKIIYSYCRIYLWKLTTLHRPQRWTDCSKPWLYLHNAITIRKNI